MAISLPSWLVVPLSPGNRFSAIHLARCYNQLKATERCISLKAIILLHCRDVCWLHFKTIEPTLARSKTSDDIRSAAAIGRSPDKRPVYFGSERPKDEHNALAMARANVMLPGRAIASIARRIFQNLAGIDAIVPGGPRQLCAAVMPPVLARIEEADDETARVHYADRRRDGELAARSSRAAIRDAGCRIPEQPVAKRI
jgi:hypothetical protein